MTKPTKPTEAMGNTHDYLPAFGRDGLLPFYDLMTRLWGAPALHRTLIDLAELDAARDVLEIGCGTGNLTKMAKRTHSHLQVIGTDPDPLALARATRKAKGLSGISFERAYAQQLNQPDASVDRILSAFMLHHLDPEVRPAVAAEALRVLRPGGAAYIVDVGGHAHDSDGHMARRHLRAAMMHDNHGDAIPSLFRDAGFASCVELTHRVTRRLGRVTFYRATI